MRSAFRSRGSCSALRNKRSEQKRSKTEVDDGNLTTYGCCNRDHWATEWMLALTRYARYEIKMGKLCNKGAFSQDAMNSPVWMMEFDIPCSVIDWWGWLMRIFKWSSSGWWSNRNSSFTFFIRWNCKWSIKKYIYTVTWAVQVLSRRQVKSSSTFSNQSSKKVLHSEHQMQHFRFLLSHRQRIV